MRFKMVKKIVKGIFMVEVFCLMFSSTVFAEQDVDKDNFDYEWYLEKHPDLAAIVDANDKEAIWDFYVNVGKPVGWIGRIEKNHLLVFYDFDDKRYAMYNPDVVAVYGTEFSALYMHYLDYGIAEGRQGYYLDTCSDLLKAKLKVYELADGFDAEYKTDRDKVKAVHDWMVKNIQYDYDNYLANKIPFQSYQVDGAMLYGKAVCQGYADTFELFMDALGIECRTVIGEIYDEQSGWIAHAWNTVRLDGVWYYIDVTWDDPVPDRGNSVHWYKYYLTTDSTFGGDHRQTE
jgi:transglutaminase-like putative cysteine protease